MKENEEKNTKMGSKSQGNNEEDFTVNTDYEFEFAPFRIWMLEK